MQQLLVIFNAAHMYILEKDKLILEKSKINLFIRICYFELRIYFTHRNHTRFFYIKYHTYFLKHIKSSHRLDSECHCA